MKFKIEKLKQRWQRILAILLRLATRLRFRIFKIGDKKRALIIIIALPLLLFVIGIVIISSHHSDQYPVHFAKPNSVVKLTKQTRPHILPAKLTQEINQVKSDSEQHYQQLQDQLNAIVNKLSVLASNQSVSQLQQSVTTPNPTLLGKMNNLQDDVKTIIHQTAKKVFLNPKVVNHYFQLVAIQGFSDGMRAIIDIDGNQTTLGINEVCPACRGWSLTSMDFTKQTATFENQHHQFVVLQAK